MEFGLLPSECDEGDGGVVDLLLWLLASVSSFRGGGGVGIQSFSRDCNKCQFIDCSQRSEVFAYLSKRIET
jgi:hypothetical protein